MYLHPMNDLSDMEFPKVLFLDHYSSPFTSVTSIYLSKQEGNSSKMKLLHILETVLCFDSVVIETVLSFRLTCLLSVGLFRFAFFRSAYHAYILASRVIFIKNKIKCIRLPIYLLVYWLYHYTLQRRRCAFAVIVVC